ARGRPPGGHPAPPGAPGRARRGPPARGRAATDGLPPPRGAGEGARAPLLPRLRGAQPRARGALLPPPPHRPQHDARAVPPRRRRDGLLRRCRGGAGEGASVRHRGGGRGGPRRPRALGVRRGHAALRGGPPRARPGLPGALEGGGGGAPGRLRGGGRAARGAHRGAPHRGADGPRRSPVRARPAGRPPRDALGQPVLPLLRAALPVGHGVGAARDSVQPLGGTRTAPVSSVPSPRLPTHRAPRPMESLTPHDLVVMLAGFAVMLGLARAAGELFNRLGQPAIVGEILAGILLGPTVLGTFAPGL